MAQTHKEVFREHYTAMVPTIGDERTYIEYELNVRASTGGAGKYMGGREWLAGVEQHETASGLVWGVRLSHDPAPVSVAAFRDIASATDGSSPKWHNLVDGDPRLVLLPWLRQMDSWCISYVKATWEERVRSRFHGKA